MVGGNFLGASGTWDGGLIGIPFIVVPGSQSKVPVTFDCQEESDPGPYPIPPNPPIEGGAAGQGDRHVLISDRDHCPAYMSCIMPGLRPTDPGRPGPVPNST